MQNNCTEICNIKPIFTRYTVFVAVESTVTRDSVTKVERPGDNAASAVSATTATDEPRAGAGDIRRPRFRNRKGGKVAARLGSQPNTTSDDGQLFNSWLSSEINKNTAKMELMKAQILKTTAQTELIQLQKEKLHLEIQKLNGIPCLLDNIVFGCSEM